MSGFSEHHEKIFEQVLEEGSFSGIALKLGLKANKVRDICQYVAQTLLAIEQGQAPQCTQEYAEVTMISYRAGQATWQARLALYRRLRDGLTRIAH